jgi:hypothetical protein
MFTLFKPRLNSSSSVNWGHCRLGELHRCSEITSGSWATPHYPICSHSLAVIRPWRLIMGPPEYCTTILLLKPSFTYLNITFSIQRFSNCSPTMNVGFVKLTGYSFCGNKVLKMNIQFCCYLCCTMIFRNNPSQCTTIYFCQFWVSSTVPLSWCFPVIHVRPHNRRNCSSRYAYNEAVFVTDAQGKRAQRSLPPSKSVKSPIFRFFHTDCHSSQSLVHWHEHYKRKNI